MTYLPRPRNGARPGKFSASEATAMHLYNLSGRDDHGCD